MGSKIPVLDLAKCQAEILQEFKIALNLGGVYLINHGVSEKLVKTAFLASHEFFLLSNVQKLSYQKKGSHSATDRNFSTEYHGYTRPAKIAKEQRNVAMVTEFREAFDICGTSRFYPDTEVPEFRTIFQNLETCLALLAKRVSNLLGASLNKHENYFGNMMKNLDCDDVPGLTSLRCLYYPAIANNQKIPEKTTRCGAHTDFGMFTLLLQDDITGLKAKLLDDWISVEPLPGAILLIMGDLWEHMTGLRALVHRVDFPDEEKMRKHSRQSITYFVHPDAHGIVTKTAENGEEAEFTIQEITMEKADREGHWWTKGQLELEIKI